MFGAGQSITRQDMAVMVFRALEARDIALNVAQEISFEDYNFISDYAKEAIDVLSGAGLINGRGSDFDPLESANRAEAAKLIYSAYKLR